MANVGREDILKSKRTLAGEWFVFFMHSPLAGFWLVTAIMVVAAAIAFVHSPRHGFEILGGVGTMTGVIKLLARSKGIAAWPTRAAYDELEAPDELEIGEGPTQDVIVADTTKAESLEQTDRGN